MKCVPLNKGFYDLPYMKKVKGFFDRLEKANDKLINVKEFEVLSALQNFTNAIHSTIVKLHSSFGLAEKIHLAPGARETFKIWHGRNNAINDIEDHAFGGMHWSC